MTGKGLESVEVGESAISFVEGAQGRLSFRGYPASELARALCYESVVHLLLRGSLPADDPPREIDAELRARRPLPAGALAVIEHLPPGAAPMDALRTMVSALDGHAFPYPPTETQGLELIARTPTLLAAFERRRHGAPPVDPDPGAGHVTDYLGMLEGRRPEPERARALERYFILLADHGMNASTFALRVVLSTQSDLLSGATTGIGALKGPLHGGAPAKAVEMLDAIGRPENAEEWIRAALARHERLMGFGHRAYKVEDPRAEALREIARGTARPERFRLAEAVERTALRALREAKPRERIYTNVEFWGGVVLEAVGLPRDLFTPTFALARTAGWAAHALEQAADNRLIRPDVRYVGPRDLHLPPGAIAGRRSD
jgi:citrate synthase